MGGRRRIISKLYRTSEHRQNSYAAEKVGSCLRVEQEGCIFEDDLDSSRRKLAVQVRGRMNCLELSAELPRWFNTQGSLQKIAAVCA